MLVCKWQIVGIVIIEFIWRIAYPIFIHIRTGLAEAFAVRICPDIAAEIASTDDVHARGFGGIPVV
ncbi:Uncharacterised protein [uncultured archaeon]|nr:Uncharacterised protein [uncultured archaeon]